MAYRKHLSRAKRVGQHNILIDNFSDFLSLCEKPVDSRLGRSSRRETAGSHWDFGLGWKGTLELARKGWAEGAEKIKEVLDKVTDILRPQPLQHEMRHDIVGAIPDIGRSIAGVPDSMIAFVPPAEPTRIIKVMVNSGASGGISADYLARRGAAIAAAIDVLESRGYRCEVWAVGASGGFSVHGSIVAGCMVKEADQPVDLARLAFSLTHPAFYRRLVFAAWETLPNQIRQHCGFHAGGGYGSVDDFKMDDVDVYFDSIYYGEQSKFATAEACAQWVKDWLLDAGLVDENAFQD